MTEVFVARKAGGGRALVVGVLIVAALIGVSSATRFPVFDDEANAITNASADVTHILSAGLGRTRQFHPPLAELVLHSWLILTGSMSPAVIRVPAIVFWLAALASLFWALLPIAPPFACVAAATTAVLWPAHLLLPFSATWYSLAALLSTLSFGALLRVLSAKSPLGAGLAASGAAVAMVLLAYTVFAWPFVVVAELTAAAFIFGLAPFRRHARPLLGAGVVLALTVGPTMVAVFARVRPMLHRQAGGGPFQSIGAVLGFLVGHSAPAASWTGCFVVVAVLGVALGIAGPDRRVRSIAAAGLISLGCLAVTNTLNDKRLLLGSMFLPAALGLRIGERRGRLALALCGMAAIPAWLGWAGITQLPWLFPRWQDPVGDIASLHVSAEKPRLLITNEPSIAFAVARMGGETGLWQAPIDSSNTAMSLRWRPGQPDILLTALKRHDRVATSRLATIDLALSTKIKDRELAIRDAFQSSGWRVVDERDFGVDSLSQFRHPGAGVSRFHFMRLTRSTDRP
jgi:hypothetical protein